VIVHITPTIMDGIVVRWNPDENSRHEISASRNGVSIKGWITTVEDHATCIAAIMIAWECYRLLASSRVSARTADVKAWLVDKGQRVVDVRFGETLAEALKREEVANG
jgi:hypothetical protein